MGIKYNSWKEFWKGWSDLGIDLADLVQALVDFGFEAYLAGLSDERKVDVLKGAPFEIVEVLIDGLTREVAREVVKQYDRAGQEKLARIWFAKNGAN